MAAAIRRKVTIMGRYEERQKRTEWFREARFGMFIHWGLYAIPARGEWVKSQERIPTETYDQYFEEFNPVRYNPREWAKLAKEAGMKYAVLTTKHHDGFCLFDSVPTPNAERIWSKNMWMHSGRKALRWAFTTPSLTGTIPIIPITATDSIP